MKLIFRDYLGSLREREELDAILPDLLSELGYTVFSRPQRGTAQSGVDIAAVGKADDGELKVYLFSVKQGNLTRQSWDGTPQALRSSLNEILDGYITTKIPKAYQNLRIVICLVFGGDMQEQVRGTVNGFIRKNSDDKVSFEEWNGDKLADLLLQGVLREEIMPKALRSHFQKAVALVDEPDISYMHFSKLVHALVAAANDDNGRVRTARQMYIALWVLFVWARDIDNVEAPYRVSEIVLLNIWNILRRYISKRRSVHNKSISIVLNSAIELHTTIALEFLSRKIIPYVDKKYALSSAVHSRSSVDVNLKLFDVLGRIAVSGLWLDWMAARKKSGGDREEARKHIAELTNAGFKIIANNTALFLPLQDEQAVDVALFLVFVVMLGGNRQDTNVWLREMALRLRVTVWTHGQYPCVFSEYRALVAHPRARTDEYRKAATSGSVLIPLIAAFLAAMDDRAALDVLLELKSKELEHCTLQVWMPDESTEDRIYVGNRDHGVALIDFPLSKTGVELLKAIRSGCTESKVFVELSAIKTGYWPIILTACRHHRLPVPPQFWIDLVDPPSMP